MIGQLRCFSPKVKAVSSELPSYKITRLRSSALQLGILLHQFLQAEARELYRNLGFFAFSFSMVDRSFAVLRMAYLLAGEESALAGGGFDRRLGDGDLLPARREELGDVFDGVIGLDGGGRLLAAWVGRAAAAACAAFPDCALVFVFVGIVSVPCIVGCLLYTSRCV